MISRKDNNAHNFEPINLRQLIKGRKIIDKVEPSKYRNRQYNCSLKRSKSDMNSDLAGELINLPELSPNKSQMVYGLKTNDTEKRVPSMFNRHRHSTLENNGNMSTKVLVKTRSEQFADWM
jgi:hypothetical protein